MKGLNFSVRVLIITIIVIAVMSIIFAGTAAGLQGQADQASCKGWLRPIASTLADMVEFELC